MNAPRRLSGHYFRDADGKPLEDLELRVCRGDGTPATVYAGFNGGSGYRQPIRTTRNGYVALYLEVPGEYVITVPARPDLGERRVELQPITSNRDHQLA